MTLLTDNEKLVHKQEHIQIDKDRSGHALLSQSVYNLEKVMQIFLLLSKSETMTIFLASQHGLESRQDTHMRIGLTKKQYYTRLSQLVKLGLLIKDENAYRHTMFGEIIYHNYLLRLGSEIRNSKYLSMFDIIKQSHRFSKDEIELFSSKIMSEGTFNNA